MEQGLTYEKLFDYLREERNNAQLQELPGTLFSDITEYLKMKEDSIESLQQSGSITSENALVQLRNAKKIIENLYERREKKLLNLALNKSRTKSQLIDTSALLPEEKIFFKQISIVLDHFRDEVLKNLLDKSVPEINEQKDSVAPERPQVQGEISEKKQEAQDAAERAKEEAAQVDTKDPEEVSEGVEPVSDEKVALKFLKYVDKFVGPDLEIMGPFEEGSVEQLPADVAEVVLKKGYAERV